MLPEITGISTVCSTVYLKKFPHYWPFVRGIHPWTVVSLHQTGCNAESVSIPWSHHNERDDVSNHRCLLCLLNCWFRRRSKKTSKLRVTGLCVGNSPVTGEFPAQKASNVENVSIWWRHHDFRAIAVGQFDGCRWYTWKYTTQNVIFYWLLFFQIMAGHLYTASY